MSRKIVSILALLCLLVVSNFAMAYNWSPNTTWRGGQGSSDWFVASNWWVSDVDPNTVPDITYQALIEPKGPIPQIDGAATCGYLNIMPWSWEGLGGAFSEFSVDMNSGTFDVNYGISIGAWGDYDSSGTFGIPAFRVRGGTVTVLTTPGDGILIGGGNGGFSLTQGKLYMYGGLINTDRLELRNGTISLYGGTLDCNLGTGFVFYQNRPINKIDISGGILKVRGDWTTGTLYSPLFPALIANGRIYSSRGVLGTPVFDGNFTTLTSTDNNMAQAWSPSPAAGAMNVHYKYATDPCYITLSWDTGGPNVIAHNVYFGTNANIVNSVYGDANYKATRTVLNADPCTWVLDDVNWPAGFKINTSYYWRVDEVWRVSDELDVNAVTKGRVWTFKTHDGKAYNPKPISGAGLSEPLQLRWTAGDFAASHQVYVGTDSSSVTSATTATAKIYRGTQTGTSYSLTNLLGTSWYGSLVPGTTYYWKIVEVSGTLTWGGGLGGAVIWTFTPLAYVNIDDFEDYNTVADINANWSSIYTSPCGGGITMANATLSLVSDSIGKHMNVLYRNYGGDLKYSEIKRVYSPTTTFTGDGELLPAPAAISIDYFGSAINGADAVYDRMYVAVEDSAGNIGIVNNPNANASKANVWTSWFISLKDFNTAPNPTALKLSAVSAFYIGFGDRLGCNYSTDGGDGNVMFDNIRMYAQTCNPAFGPAADLDSDCDVDINDLDRFATEWLYRAELRTFPVVTQPAAPVLWYKFDDTGTTTDVVDSSGNGYTGTVQRWLPISFDATGSRKGDGCLYLPDIPPHNAMSYVDIPLRVVDGNGVITDGGNSITFSLWVNASFPGDFYTQWGGIFGVWSALGEYIEIPLPTRVGPGFSGDNGNMGFMKHIHTTPVTTASATANNIPLLNFGGRWNHWVFRKTPTQMAVYLNGNQLAVTDANGQPGDPNAAVNDGLWSAFATEGVNAFRLGTRGTNWAMWAGRLDDFQIYNYALSDAEIAYLASDGTGSLMLPLSTRSNLTSTGLPQDQVINFADLAEMCTEWHTMKLWP